MPLNVNAPLAPQITKYTKGTLLFLRNHHLGTSKEKLIPVFAAIPKKVLSIDLGWNFLNKLTSAQLITAFSALHNELSSLTLCHNYLSSYKKDLLAVFTSIPKSVTSIDLSDNELGEYTGDELVIMFAALPPGIKSIDVRKNSLANITEQQWTKILNSLPDLSKVHCDEENQENINKILQKIRADIQETTDLGLNLTTMVMGFGCTFYYNEPLKLDAPESKSNNEGKTKPSETLTKIASFQ
jgi:hypothetical protein